MTLTQLKSRVLVVRKLLTIRFASVHGQPFFKSKEDTEFFRKLDSYYREGKFNQLNNCPSPFQSRTDRNEVINVWLKMNGVTKSKIDVAPEWPLFKQLFIFCALIAGGFLISAAYFQFWPKYLVYKYKYRYGEMAHLSPAVTGESHSSHDHESH